MFRVTQSDSCRLWMVGGGGPLCRWLKSPAASHVAVVEVKKSQCNLRASLLSVRKNKEKKKKKNYATENPAHIKDRTLLDMYC